MNLTKKDCDSWRVSPEVNPTTGRKIKLDGSIYKQIQKECDSPITKKECDKWKKDPSKHPVTGRKISSTTKNGIYHQLLKICGSSIIPKPSKSTSPVVKDDLEAQRAKLILAVRKAIAPVLHKDNTQMRIEFNNIMNKYLKDLKPCLEEQNNKLCLVSKKNNIVIQFDKQIGSTSKYGIAFLNMGKGFASLLKFSCKIMSAKLPAHVQEIEILEKMSNLVIKGISPNMPMIYKTLNCTRKCKINLCPDLTTKQGYFVVINELANSDLQTWFKGSYSREVYESILMQILFAIYTFHSLGWSHQDCHLGNFLVHHIKAGGCWRYQVGGKNVYVPNHGFLLVLWDPGLASSMTDFKTDYDRTFRLIANMEHYKLYTDAGLNKPPKPLVDFGIVPVINSFNFSIKDEKHTIIDIIDRIKSDVIKFKSIVVDDTPPSHLLNVKAYKVE